MSTLFSIKSHNKNIIYMKHIEYIMAALALASCSRSEKPQPLHLNKLPGNNKPLNIIFILSDDHRYDYMSFMGKVPWLKTPNMDRMAAEGVHIKNAFVTTSLSSPSRATILTGLYSHTHLFPKDLLFFLNTCRKPDILQAFLVNGIWEMNQGNRNPGLITGKLSEDRENIIIPGSISMGYGLSIKTAYM
jgi:N-acetylglucosamine-6-sulfatase